MGSFSVFSVVYTCFHTCFRSSASFSTCPSYFMDYVVLVDQRALIRCFAAHNADGSVLPLSICMIVGRYFSRKKSTNVISGQSALIICHHRRFVWMLCSKDMFVSDSYIKLLFVQLTSLVCTNKIVTNHIAENSCGRRMRN